MRLDRAASKTHVTNTNWLWIDVDSSDGLPTLTALLRRKPAHLIVESAGSGGVHCYWRLRTPLHARTDKTMPAGAADWPGGWLTAGATSETIERAHQRLIYALEETLACPVSVFTDRRETGVIEGIVDYKVRNQTTSRYKADRDVQATLYLAERWLAGRAVSDFRFAQVSKPGKNPPEHDHRARAHATQHRADALGVHARRDGRRPDPRRLQAARSRPPVGVRRTRLLEMRGRRRQRPRRQADPRALLHALGALPDGRRVMKAPGQPRGGDSGQAAPGRLPR